MDKSQWMPLPLVTYVYGYSSLVKRFDKKYLKELNKLRIILKLRIWKLFVFKNQILFKIKKNKYFSHFRLLFSNRYIILLIYFQL